LTEEEEDYQSLFKVLGKTRAIIEFDTTGNILRANQINALYHQGDSPPASPNFCLPEQTSGGIARNWLPSMRTLGCVVENSQS